MTPTRNRGFLFALDFSYFAKYIITKNSLPTLHMISRNLSYS
jgi:hypothetical protein